MQLDLVGKTRFLMFRLLCTETPEHYDLTHDKEEMKLSFGRILPLRPRFPFHSVHNHAPLSFINRSIL